MCIYKGQNYSEGSIIRFDDGKLYQCYSGGWRLWSNFTTFITTSDKPLEKADELIDFTINETDNNSFKFELIKIGESFEIADFNEVRQINIDLSDGKINILINYKTENNHENYTSAITENARIYGNSVKFLEYTTRTHVTFYLKNMGSFNNSYVVWDRRNGSVIFTGIIAAWNQAEVKTSASDAGYGDISYSKNGNSPYGVPWIKTGDTVNT